MVNLKVLVLQERSGIALPEELPFERIQPLINLFSQGDPV
jgi:hypothetical protein